MKKGILFAGHMAVDNVKYVENYPEAHSLTTITDTFHALGGLACNCAIDLAKMDSTVPVKVLGMVGNDSLGEQILSEFSNYPSINTDMLIREGDTSYTDVMTTPDGGRTFFQFRGANALLSPAHFDFSKISADIMHIGYLLLLDKMDMPYEDYPTAMCKVLADAQANGILTSIDVVSEDSNRFPQIVLPALQYTDYCIVNEFESSRTTGIELRNDKNELISDNLPKVLNTLLDHGVKKWVVIHTPEMSCGMDSETRAYTAVPSWRIPKEKIKSSVGAGDAFATTILYGVYSGWDMEKSLTTAAAVAAHSLFGGGASDSIIPLKEMLDNILLLQS